VDASLGFINPFRFFSILPQTTAVFSLLGALRGVVPYLLFLKPLFSLPPLFTPVPAPPARGAPTSLFARPRTSSSALFFLRPLPPHLIFQKAGWSVRATFGHHVLTFPPPFFLRAVSPVFPLLPLVRFFLCALTIEHDPVRTRPHPLPGSSHLMKPFFSSFFSQHRSTTSPPPSPWCRDIVLFRRAVCFSLPLPPL